jgi:hypothetical protein
VNADGRDDLYIVRGGTGNAADLLLISTRSGRRFRRAAIPQTRIGSADDVVSIDHDRNGLADFLVLNGLRKPGPLREHHAHPQRRQRHELRGASLP